VEAGSFVGDACRAIACPGLRLCSVRTPHLEWRVVEVAADRYPLQIPCPVLGDGGRMREVVAIGQPLPPPDNMLALDPVVSWVRPQPAPPRPRARVRPARAQRIADLFLADAMVFIGAEHGDPLALRILEQAGSAYALALTPEVLDELRTRSARARADDCEVIDASDLDEQAFEGLWYAYHKRPSKADMSLLRAAVKDNRVKGIVTSDSDLTETAAGAIVSQLTGRLVRVLRPSQFAQEYLEE
jgi:rRNA-processing protein FCF1